MNNQQLNNAFDSFAPSPEQKRRMYDNIMLKKSAQNNNVFSWKKIYIPAAGVAAAVMVYIASSGVIAPDVAPGGESALVYHNEQNDDGNIKEEQKIENPVSTVESYEKAADTSVQDKQNASVQEKDTSSNTQTTSPVAPQQPDANTAVTDVEQSQSNAASNNVFTSVIEQQQQKLQMEQIQEQPEIVPESATTFALNINDASVNAREKTAVMPETASVTTADADVPAYDGYSEPRAASASGGSGGGSSAAAVSGGGSSAAKGYDMTYAQFCEKIGTDIRSNISIPGDMTDITDDTEYIASSNQTVFEWNIVYTGNDARVINITVNNDVEENKHYFEDNAIVKTNINGVDAVVMADGGSYTAYIIKNNVSYTVNTNITEQELTDLLVSIG